MIQGRCEGGVTKDYRSDAEEERIISGVRVASYTHNLVVAFVL